MKTITTIIALLFCAFTVIAQNETAQQQVSNTKDALQTQLVTYSGNNNGTFYFKNKEDGGLITFSNINEEIILRNGFKNKEALDKVFKITSKIEKVKVDSKEENNDDAMVSVTTYQKVYVLVNIEEMFNKEIERSLGLN